MHIEGTSTPTSTFASCPAIPALKQPINGPSPIVDESSGPIDSLMGTPSAFCSNPRPPPDSRNLKNRSEVWFHFIRVPDCDPEEAVTTCNHCQRQWKCHPKRQGTSAMKSTCHSKSWTRVKHSWSQNKK
ncbi:hypothetical protein I3760_01G062400 [Carya illinoinensis]|nr:hypothetical protein I3760_01G062400 [Carya illinoinensis]